MPDDWSDSHVALVFDSTNELLFGDEPDDFIREHSGKVVLFEEAWEDTVQIGTFRAFYINAKGATNESVSIYDVFDTRSETFPFYELYDDMECFTEAARKAARTDYEYEPNLLILDRLEILPAYRGNFRGLKALKGLIHWLQPGAGIVAMKPFPLQFESSARRRPPDDPDAMMLEAFKGPFVSARAKLRRYYAKLGFRLVPKTDFMVRAADLPLPDLPED